MRLLTIFRDRFERASAMAFITLIYIWAYLTLPKPPMPLNSAETPMGELSAISSRGIILGPSGDHLLVTRYDRSLENRIKSLEAVVVYLEKQFLMKHVWVLQLGAIFGVTTQALQHKYPALGSLSCSALGSFGERFTTSGVPASPKSEETVSKTPQD